MTKELFDNIQTLGNINLAIDETIQLGIVSCTGTTKEVQGIAKMQIHFLNAQKQRASTIMTVMVVPNLSEDFIIGYDFLGSERVISFNKHNVMLKASTQNFLVPIITKQLPIIPCRINTSTLIPPQSFKWLTTTLIGESIDPHIPVMIDNISIQCLNILDISYYPSKEGTITFPVFNESVDDIEIPANTNLATVTTLHTYAINRMDIIDMYEHMPINLTSYDFIQKDTGLTDTEKFEAQIHFENTGVHQPSMTHIIEKYSGLTELELQDIEPISEENFNSQFVLDHLSPRDKNKALKIFQKHKNAFSSHTYDIGKAHDIEMSIDLNTTQPKLQKYIPIPHNVRPQVKEILDQMIKFGILRECDEPSLFCSNLLVVKKKDGKSIRILLDGRLLNEATIRLPMILVNKNEVLAHLVNKKHVSTIDLSDAFFHIPLEEKSTTIYSILFRSAWEKIVFSKSTTGFKELAFISQAFNG